jgi:flagellar motor switch protein FliN/FliY
VESRNRIGSAELDSLLERLEREALFEGCGADGLPELTQLAAPGVEPHARSESSIAGELARSLRLRVRVELGRVSMPLSEALALAPGSVLDLARSAGDPVTLLVSDVPVARGQVLVVDDRFCLRVTEVLPKPHSGGIGR